MGVAKNRASRWNCWNFKWFKWFEWSNSKVASPRLHQSIPKAWIPEWDQPISLMSSDVKHFDKELRHPEFKSPAGRNGLSKAGNHPKKNKKHPKPPQIGLDMMIKSVDPCLLSSLVIAVVITLICGLGQTSFLSELPTQMAPWDFAARGSQKTTNETTSKERLRKTPICFCVVKTECSVCVVNVMCPPVRWHFPSKLVGAQHLQHLPVWRHGITASSRKPTGKCWKCIRKTLETSGGDTRQSLYAISSLPPRKGEISRSLEQSARSHTSVTCLAQVCICCRPWAIWKISKKPSSETLLEIFHNFAPERLSAIACCTKRSFQRRLIHRFTDSVSKSQIFQKFCYFQFIYTDIDWCKLHRFQILTSSSLLGIYKNLNYVLGICWIAFHAAKSPILLHFGRFCRLAGLLVWSKTVKKITRNQTVVKRQTDCVFFWKQSETCRLNQRGSGFNLKKTHGFRGC